MKDGSIHFEMGCARRCSVLSRASCCWHPSHRVSLEKSIDQSLASYCLSCREQCWLRCRHRSYYDVLQIRSDCHLMAILAQFYWRCLQELAPNLRLCALKQLINRSLAIQNLTTVKWTTFMMATLTFDSILAWHLDFGRQRMPVESLTSCWMSATTLLDRRHQDSHSQLNWSSHLLEEHHFQAHRGPSWNSFLKLTKRSLRQETWAAPH